MTDQSIPGHQSSSRAALPIALAMVGALGACGGGAPALPDPRPVVIYSGARIRADKDSLQEIDRWVTREQDNIEQDPGFWVITDPAADEGYPWEGFRISGDSVHVRLDLRAMDTRLPFEIYGHLHLMAAVGRQEEWLPEAPTAAGYALERAILARVADAWLLGRTAFDTSPYGPLDELVYAKDAGYLDAFIFTARPDEFGEARAAWAREHPGEADAYREWFVKTFNREPPGLRTG